MKKMRLYVLAVAFCTVLSIAPAYAEWGPWQSIGDGVDVSFSMVNNDTCTWKIRNSDSTRTLKTLDFQYTYVPVSDPYGQKTDGDVLPYPLKPGAVVGGWTAYSANTHMCPLTLIVTKLERSAKPGY